MEPNQTIPSPDNSGIPQGIPTGVFVPNNQTPAPVVTPTPTPTVTPAPVVTPVPAKEGALDRFFKGLVKFLAKISGQPDPITGAPNTSKAAEKTENIVGKVWDVANQAVTKATDVAGKAVATATNVTNQATAKIQQVIPPPAAAPQTPAPDVTPAPTAPEQPK